MNTAKTVILDKSLVDCLKVFEIERSYWIIERQINSLRRLEKSISYAETYEIKHIYYLNEYLRHTNEILVYHSSTKRDLDQCSDFTKFINAYTNFIK